MNRHHHAFKVAAFLFIFVSSYSCKSSVDDADPTEPSMQTKPTSITFDEVMVHPPFRERFTCTEHAEGELPHLGDALGRDCVVMRLIEEGGRLWLRSYKSKGLKNEDWYSWGSDVLAPFTAQVTEIHLNPKINKPGIMGKDRATTIVFEREDGVKVALVHLQEVKVKVGDKVQAGDVVGSVGNNGYSRHPHIHIGSWHDKTPLQIRMDLKAQGALMPEKVKEPSEKPVSKNK